MSNWLESEEKEKSNLEQRNRLIQDTLKSFLICVID